MSHTDTPPITAARFEEVLHGQPVDFGIYAFHVAIDPESHTSLCVTCDTRTADAFMIEADSSLENEDAVCLWCALGLHGDDLKMTDSVDFMDMMHAEVWFMAFNDGFFGRWWE